MRTIAGRVLAAALFALGCRAVPAVGPHEGAPATITDPPRPAAPPTPDDSAPPNRLLAAGNTRGTVACGASRCTVPAEICVLLEPSAGAAANFRCVQRGRELEAAQSFACDDASDCSNGQACCLGFQSASEVYACSERSGANANCALESCVEPGGAPCPTGQVCKAGTCAPASAGATCSGGQRCPLSAPICVWASGAAACAREVADSASEPSTTAVRMSCTATRDCGAGLRCCTNALGNNTSCRVNCDAANNQELCERDADCPAGGSTKLRCAPPSADEPAHFPRWVRFCQAR